MMDWFNIISVGFGLVSYLMAGFFSIGMALSAKEYMEQRTGVDARDELYDWVLPFVAGIIAGTIMYFFWWVVLPLAALLYLIVKFYRRVD